MYLYTQCPHRLSEISSLTIRCASLILFLCSQIAYIGGFNLVVVAKE